MLKVIDHPLIKHKLTVMRKKETGTKVTTSLNAENKPALEQKKK